MTDALITEYAGTRRDGIARFYQYGSGGVRVLDAHKTIRRWYQFDPSSDIMTERDPLHPEKILRRFVFDRYGMLEERFAFGECPRTFRYEDGARQIAVREGGDYGAVGKIITFENNGITETAWGRNGEIEHVYQFDANGGAITVRAGGWYGDVERTIVIEGINASLFYEPEAFLQFLMFTEWSAQDRDKEVNERVAMIRGGNAAAAGRAPAVYSDGEPPGAKAGAPVGRKPGRLVPPQKRARQAAGHSSDDPGIDFIPDSDSPAVENSRKEVIFSRQSRDISWQERRDRDENGGEKLSRGKSAEIPLEDRFGSSSREPERLSRGKSAEIPLEERFENAQKQRGKLTRGRSVDIPYEERRGDGDR